MPEEMSEGSEGVQSPSRPMPDFFIPKIDSPCVIATLSEAKGKQSRQEKEIWDSDSDRCLLSLSVL